jgi:hypothetical protein
MNWEMVLLKTRRSVAWTAVSRTSSDSAGAATALDTMAAMLRREKRMLMVD